MSWQRDLKDILGIVEKFKYNIGDEVEIFCTGSLYANYDVMAKIMNLKNWKNHRRMKSGYWNRTYIVVARNNHPSFNRDRLYGIEDTENGLQYIYGERGIMFK